MKFYSVSEGKYGVRLVTPNRIMAYWYKNYGYADVEELELNHETEQVGPLMFFTGDETVRVIPEDIRYIGIKSSKTLEISLQTGEHYCRTFNTDEAATNAYYKFLDKFTPVS